MGATVDPLKEKVFPSVIGRAGVLERASSAVPGIAGMVGVCISGTAETAGIVGEGVRGWLRGWFRGGICAVWGAGVIAGGVI